MTIGGIPRFIVIDDFLPAPQLSGLLEFALEHRHMFTPAGVMRDGVSQISTQARISEQCELGLGPHETAFVEAVHQRLGDFIRDLGVPAFPLRRTETQLIAHGDQAFYKAHIDTHTQSSRTDEIDSDRVLSAVYYFYREPKGFSGGEIALHPFDKEGEPIAIEPLRNRLVVFPSFAWHEVRKIVCPSGEFADSRFAINCWLHRERAGAKREAADA